MPRITYVKKAQQRYALVPVLNEDGTQKATPVMRKDGEPRLTKHGRPVVARQSVEDKSQPLPMPICECCRKPLEVGQPYKHVTPKGSGKRVRCGACPTWEPWDLSNALWARLAELQHDYAREFTEEDEEDDVTSALAEAAEAIREIAEEKREAAENLREGFGHDTSQSEELDGIADELEAWADDVEYADVPTKPEAPDEVEDPGEEPEDGTDERRAAYEEAREEFEAYLEAMSEYQSDVEAWVEEANEAYNEALDACPV